MAKPITNIEKRIKDPVQEQQQAAGQLLGAAADHHMPLIKFMRILTELDQLGMLDAAEGILKNSKPIAFIALEQINKPGMHRAIKNAMGAGALLSAIEPDKLQRILKGVSAGVENITLADEPGPKERRGLWGMLRSMRDPAVMTSVGMMTDFLKGMGRGLKSR